MDKETFWNLIETAKEQSGGDLKMQVKLLIDSLLKLSVEDIMAFDRLFQLHEAIAYTRELGDVYEIICSYGDDGFMDFRGWLIAQGRTTYWNAVNNPDVLANTVHEGEDPILEEILSAAWSAYEQKTGERFPIVSGGASVFPTLRGERVKQSMFAQSYPKTVAKFTDYFDIYPKYASLVGKKAWGVALGVGSFITMEFGKRLAPYITNQGREVTHGEWHLWVYECAWRLESAKGLLVDSESERVRIEPIIKRLENATLEAIDVLLPGDNTVFVFDNQLMLQLIPSHTSKDLIHWMLFTPEKKVLTIGPGTDWSYEDE